jgi:hypothetical protein
VITSHQRRLDNPIPLLHYGDIFPNELLLMRKPRSRKPPTIRYNNTALLRVGDAVRGSPLSLINLSVRTINVLKQSRINTVGELIDRARISFVIERGAGRHSLRDIHEALRSLAASVQAGGAVNWMTYAQNRKILILPRRTSRKGSAAQFLKVFPEAAKAAVNSSFRVPVRTIFWKYLFQESPRPTVRLAKVTGYSKQGISLIRKNVLMLLRGAILQDDYTGCGFRFRPEFVMPLRELAVAMAGQKSPLLYSRWAKILKSSWAVVPADLGKMESTILDLLGYKVFRPSGNRHAPALGTTRQQVADLSSSLRTAQRILRMDFPAGLSSTELAQVLRDHSWDRKSAW